MPHQAQILQESGLLEQGIFTGTSAQEGNKIITADGSIITAAAGFRLDTRPKVMEDKGFGPPLIDRNLHVGSRVLIRPQPAAVMARFNGGMITAAAALSEIQNYNLNAVRFKGGVTGAQLLREGKRTQAELDERSLGEFNSKSNRGEFGGNTTTSQGKTYHPAFLQGLKPSQIAGLGPNAKSVPINFAKTEPKGFSVSDLPKLRQKQRDQQSEFGASEDATELPASFDVLGNAIKRLEDKQRGTNFSGFFDDFEEEGVLGDIPGLAPFEPGRTFPQTQRPAPTDPFEEEAGFTPPPAQQPPPVPGTQPTPLPDDFEEGGNVLGVIPGLTPSEPPTPPPAGLGHVAPPFPAASTPGGAGLVAPAGGGTGQQGGTQQTGQAPSPENPFANVPPPNWWPPEIEWPPSMGGLDFSGRPIVAPEVARKFVNDIFQQVTAGQFNSFNPQLQEFAVQAQARGEQLANPPSVPDPTFTQEQFGEQGFATGPGGRDFFRGGPDEAFRPLPNAPPPLTVSQQIDQAILDGSFDTATALANFQARPDRTDLFEAAMSMVPSEAAKLGLFQAAIQFAQSPADQFVISNIARGQLPLETIQQQFPDTGQGNDPLDALETIMRQQGMDPEQIRIARGQMEAAIQQGADPELALNSLGFGDSIDQFREMTLPQDQQVRRLGRPPELLQQAFQQLFDRPGDDPRVSDAFNQLRDSALGDPFAGLRPGGQQQPGQQQPGQGGPAPSNTPSFDATQALQAQMTDLQARFNRGEITAEDFARLSQEFVQGNFTGTNDVPVPPLGSQFPSESESDEEFSPRGPQRVGAQEVNQRQVGFSGQALTNLGAPPSFVGAGLAIQGGGGVQEVNPRGGRSQGGTRPRGLAEQISFNSMGDVQTPEEVQKLLKQSTINTGQAGRILQDIDRRSSFGSGNTGLSPRPSNNQGLQLPVALQSLLRGEAIGQPKSLLAAAGIRPLSAQAQRNLTPTEFGSFQGLTRSTGISDAELQRELKTSTPLGPAPRIGGGPLQRRGRR